MHDAWYIIDKNLHIDVTELCAFFYVAFTVLSLEGENKRNMESIGDKKVYGISFYPTHLIAFFFKY